MQRSRAVSSKTGPLQVGTDLTNQVIQPSLFTGEETEDQKEWFPWSFKAAVVEPKQEVKQREQSEENSKWGLRVLPHSTLDASPPTPTSPVGRPPPPQSSSKTRIWTFKCPILVLPQPGIILSIQLRKNSFLIHQPHFKHHLPQLTARKTNCLHHLSH